MYRFYCYVPPCRKCGSFRTGHFVIGNIVDKSLSKKSLSRGEYITPIPFLSKEESNCYCMDCGITWYQELKLSLYSRAQIEEQKRLREIKYDKNISKNIDNYFSNHKSIKNNKNNTKKKKTAEAFKKISINIHCRKEFINNGNKQYSLGRKTFIYAGAIKCRIHKEARRAEHY